MGDKAVQISLVLCSIIKCRRLTINQDTRLHEWLLRRSLPYGARSSDCAATGSVLKL
jgi:hypothetical protein